MKKFMAVLMILVCVLTFSACNESTTDNSSAPSNDSSDISGEQDANKTDNDKTTFFEGTVSPYSSVRFIDSNDKVIISNFDISAVLAMQLEVGGYSLQFNLSEQGAEKFATATSENLGKEIYIVINNEVVFSPVVVSPITTAEFIINNIESKEKLTELYNLLTNPTLSPVDNLPIENDSMYFSFLGGAGGWRTELVLNKDGTFVGCYSDSEMGSIGDEYPNGTVYICNFTGKFTNVQKINDYSYKMELTDIELEQPVGTEWIDDKIKYIASDPYGLKGSKEFIFYTPKAPIEGLPDYFLSWWPLRYDQNTDPKETLSCYGILNVATYDGFFTNP